MTEINSTPQQENDNSDVCRAIQQQAMVYYMALDRLLGALENYPLYGVIERLRDDLPIVKAFIDHMRSFANAQIAGIDEDEYQRLLREAEAIIVEWVAEANRNPRAY